MRQQTINYTPAANNDTSEPVGSYWEEWELLDDGWDSINCKVYHVHESAINWGAK